MAYFAKSLGTTDPQGNQLDPEQWSQNIFTNALERGSLADQTGPVGSASLVQVDEDLTLKPGSTINYTFVPYKKNPMIIGNEAGVRKNASAMSEFGLPITIDILTASFFKKGRLTDQNLVWNFRETAKGHLERREMDSHEDLNIAALSGVTYTEINDVSNPHLSAADTVDRVNGDTRCLRSSGGSATAAVTAANSDNAAIVGAMSSTDVASVELIDNCFLQARTNDPYLVTPLMLQNGELVYVMYFSLRAAKQVKRDPLFEKYNLAKITAGGGNDPFANASFGQWENVLLKSNERIIEFGATGNKFARNLFCGGQAVINLFGNLQADYTEETTDHKTDTSAATATIRGQSKVTFNGTDVNVIQAITASN